MIRRAQEETGSDGSILRWAFPGGKQRIGEHRETREECVKREILAETGYIIKVIRQIALKVHPQFLVLVAYHLCDLEKEEPIAEP